ncbi:MAG: hypothetical protein IPJ19_09525 [Planctomycetes bacterium]|nr:hypothetical protein [Planctomycetota bacterium]
MTPIEPKQQKTETPKPAPQKREERGEEQKQTTKLDFAKLDLRIEKVDERISPSETNVFDK